MPGALVLVLGRQRGDALDVEVLRAQLRCSARVAQVIEERHVVVDVVLPLVGQVVFVKIASVGQTGSHAAVHTFIGVNVEHPLAFRCSRRAFLRTPGRARPLGCAIVGHLLSHLLVSRHVVDCRRLSAAPRSHRAWSHAPQVIAAPDLLTSTANAQPPPRAPTGSRSRLHMLLETTGPHRCRAVPARTPAARSPPPRSTAGWRRWNDYRSTAVPFDQHVVEPGATTSGRGMARRRCRR